MKISTNKSVSASYELYVGGENESLELMERATTEKPLTFIYGVGMMLPKFEENLLGLASGDEFEFSIDVEDAYGQYIEENVIDLDRSIFEQEGKLDEKVIFAGNVVPLMDTEGNRINAQILEVTDSHVKVDLNHPLAGENLHFKGSVLGVRESTKEELAALTNESCGCGNDDCGCGPEKDDACGCGCH